MADTTRTIKLKLDADAGGLVAGTKLAEHEVDKFTRSADKKFRTSGDTTSKGFASRFVGGFKNLFSGNGGGFAKMFSGAAREAESAGATAGEDAAQGMSKGIKSPAAIGAITVAVAALLPYAANILSAGMVLVGGGAIAALGLAFAAKSPKIVKQFDKLKTDIGKTMTQISKPFEGTLSSMIDTARQTFASFVDPLKQSFKEIAPALSNFGVYLGRAFQQLAPAVKPISDAFVAMLDSLGPALPGIVKGISDGIISIADSIKKDPGTFTGFIKFLGFIVEWSLKAIGWLSSLASTETKVFEAIGHAGMAFASNMISVSKAVVSAFKFLTDAGLDAAYKLVSAFAKIPGPQQAAMKKAADAIKGFKASADKSFDGAINKLDEWDTKLKNAPKIAKLQGDITDLQQKLTLAENSLRNPNLTKTKRAKIEANIQQLESQISKAQGRIDALRGKTVVIKYTATGVNLTTPSGVGRRASGGPVSAGRTYLVGEKGPELLTMGGDGYVTPNHKLSGGDTYVYVTIDGEQLQGRIDKTIRTSNRQLKRTVGAGKR